MELTFGSKKHDDSSGKPDPSNPAQKKEGGLSGLFGQKPQGPSVPPELSDEINNIARRLKLVEEHFTILRRKIDVTERNLMSRTKNFAAEIKTVNSELSEMRQSMNKIEDQVLVMIKEFQLTAKKEDHEILKKYVEMWSPIKFVTRDEVEKIVQDALEEKSGKNI